MNFKRKWSHHSLTLIFTAIISFPPYSQAFHPSPLLYFTPSPLDSHKTNFFKFFKSDGSVIIMIKKREPLAISLHLLFLITNRNPTTNTTQRNIRTIANVCLCSLTENTMRWRRCLPVIVLKKLAFLHLKNKYKT
jgi:hypothetical protein